MHFILDSARADRLRRQWVDADTGIPLELADCPDRRPAGNTVLACEVADSTGELTAVFYGRAHIAGVEPGTRIRLHGTVGISADGHPAMINPGYELLR